MALLSTHLESGEGSYTLKIYISNHHLHLYIIYNEFTMRETLHRRRLRDCVDHMAASKGYYTCGGIAPQKQYRLQKKKKSSVEAICQWKCNII